MQSNEIRRRFLDYFRKRDHAVMPGSSLIPEDDPTLLFVNAGMVQFKDEFLGITPRRHARATTAQRCLRAGGKHNDLENVGYTARHHTFFEMLGNFSFGNYFKREAINFAWEFLTRELRLPPEKLWVTVYQDDSEAEAIWLQELKVDPARFSRCGEKDNFWSMGDTGPCGPCTEIFYDHGDTISGGPPGSPDEDGDRYVEIWNLVFMQYDRAADGTLTPLAKRSVDTGMGLERLAAVLQGVHNNYDTDLFQPLITAAVKMTRQDKPDLHALRVLADHIRSSAFLITDGVRPSNEGRGYVLRRIIRRAASHGHKLGLDEPFFYKLLPTLVDIMGEAYPQLNTQRDIIAEIIQAEEQQFAQTLTQGMRILEQGLQGLSGKSDQVVPGELVFTLYDTYGFPVDLTADIARERGLRIDEAALQEQMDKQRRQSRTGGKFKAGGDALPVADVASEFIGYRDLTGHGAVTALLRDGQAVTQLSDSENGDGQDVIVLAQTPFYAESGGQVGDVGVLSDGDNRFVVTDTQKQGDAILHFGHVERGTFRLGDQVEARVDAAVRCAVVLNHSATHLLHAALRLQLGEHVVQKGSLVNADYLRFDFSYPKAVSTEDLATVERLVNTHIRSNHRADVAQMSRQAAQDAGAMALFGEKYADEVRVMAFGEFSKELCGGTHVQSTGDIGLFKITRETGVAAGIRRIEAVTGEKALDWTQRRYDTMQQTVAAWQEKYRQQEKRLRQMQLKLNREQGDTLLEQAKDVNGIKVLAASLPQADAKALRDTLDRLRDKLGRCAVVLAGVDGEKIQLVAGVAKGLTDPLHAGKLVAYVAAQIGGKGGGRPDMAAGGGTRPHDLPQALDSVTEWVEQQLLGEQTK